MVDCLPFQTLGDDEFLQLLNFSWNRPAIDPHLMYSNFKPLVNYIENNLSSLVTGSSSFENVTLQAFNNMLNSKQQHLSHGISVVHLNIRSLNANLEEFQALVNSFSHPVDAIILTEIWTTNISFFKNILPSYDFFVNLPNNTKVGGVGAFIRRELKADIRLDLKLDFNAPNICENIWLEVCKNNSKFIIAGLYRHPQKNINILLDKLQNNLHTIATSQSSYPCLIATDCNINLLQF